jgi:hypothetical protein
LELLVENEKGEKKRIATEGLLWLLRGLSFTCKALQNAQGNKDEELAAAFTKSYDVTLKKFHNFVVKGIFSVSCGSSVLAEFIELYSSQVQIFTLSLLLTQMAARQLAKRSSMMSWTNGWLPSAASLLAWKPSTRRAIMPRVSNLRPRTHVLELNTFELNTWSHTWSQMNNLHIFPNSDLKQQLREIRLRPLTLSMTDVVLLVCIFFPTSLSDDCLGLRVHLRV